MSVQYIVDGKATWRSHVGLSLMVFIGLLCYIVRYIFAGVLNQLQTEFDKSDTEIGLVQTAFVVTYMFASPVFGYMGDRYPRRPVMVFSVLLFCAASFASGVASNFWTFMGMRALLGVGEAGFATLSPALLADMYPERQRPLVLGIYFASIPIGSALGFVVGGAVGGWLGWRWAFYVTGPPGVLLAMMYFFLVPDPQSKLDIATRNKMNSGAGTISAWDAIMHDAKQCLQIPSFLFSTLGNTGLVFVSSGLASFFPVYIHRAAGISEADAAIAFGGIACASGVIGSIAGSMAADRLRGKVQAPEAVVCTVGLAFSMPLGVGAVLLAFISLDASYMLGFFAELLMFVVFGPNMNLLLKVVPSAIRSTGVALQIMVSHLFGDAISSFIIGAMSDMFQISNKEEDEALCLALSISMGIGLMAAAAMSMAIKHFPFDEAAKEAADTNALKGQSLLADTEESGSRTV